MRFSPVIFPLSPSSKPPSQPGKAWISWQVYWMNSLREISPNTIEMAKSMGASPFQIIVKVMIPECVPSLISNATIAITTILGYSAMSGIIGGGGLGKIAINYGYYRYKYLIMIAAVILLIVLVQIFQTVGTKLAVKLDKRIKNRK